MSTKPDSQPPRVRIELLKPHRHAGREYKTGQFLELPEDKADWLSCICGRSRTATVAPSAVIEIGDPTTLPPDTPLTLWTASVPTDVWPTSLPSASIRGLSNDTPSKSVVL